MTKIELFVIIGILTFFVSPVDGIVDNDSNNSNSTTYRTFVDSYKGLYRVINMDTKDYAPYENKTLVVNIGDTVEWINDDDTGLTIISNEKLWKDKYGYMKSTWKRFNYTFTKSGNYTFYIRQYAAKFQPQTIVVSPTNSIKSKENRTTKSNSTINTSRKTVVRIINSDKNNNNSDNNESEKSTDLSKSNMPGGINKFSSEIFLFIMIACAIYLTAKFKKKI